jgi:hypothetical protein
MDAPTHAIPPLFLHAWSKYSIGMDFINANALSAIWPSANRAIYWPIRIPCRYPVRRVWVYNGAAVSGNFDFGLYSMKGYGKIFSTGAVAQAGTNVPQYVALDYELDSGVYLCGLSLSNVTGRFFRAAISNALGRIGGMFEEAAAHPLPDIATPAQFTSTYIPLAGLTLTDSGY